MNVRRLLATVVSIAGLSAVVACGSDESSVEPVAAETTSVAATISDDSTPASATTDTPVETSTDALLVSSLPEISGPTVLWFWAPG